MLGNFYDYRDEDEVRARAVRFHNPGGKSALHPGRRAFNCPSCGKPNRLTSKDVKAGYQCDVCADGEEGSW